MRESWRQGTGGAAIQPSSELIDGDESPASAANDSKFVHDVFLEEVNADAERGRGLRLAEGEPGKA
jgi:hypothetical protein